MVPADLSFASKLSITFAGAFLLTGLLTGVWKYAHMMRSREATAPAYVDIAHRASLMYAFASLVLLVFVELSPWSDGVTLVLALAPQLFFALAIGSYVIHGVLQDTDHQLRRPHRLGAQVLPRWAVHVFMGLLILAELGGFGALFLGGLWTLFAAGGGGAL